jgi:hypothetical protein
MAFYALCEEWQLVVREATFSSIPSLEIRYLDSSPPFEWAIRFIFSASVSERANKYRISYLPGILFYGAGTALAARKKYFPRRFFSVSRDIPQ